MKNGSYQGLGYPINLKLYMTTIYLYLWSDLVQIYLHEMNNTNVC